MIERALSAVAGFLGLCLSLSVQQTVLADTLSALNSNSVRFPSLALSEGASFSFASAVEATTPDFLPPLSFASVSPTSRKDTATERRGYRKDSSKEVVEAERPLFDYADGEVGFLYGRSIGKGGRELEEGYVFGEAGNDKFQISAGAFYENWSGRVRRLGR
jgi:hypothetical protein